MLTTEGNFQILNISLNGANSGQLWTIREICMLPTDQIYIYDKDGKKNGNIEVPVDPSSIRFGGADGNTLFITSRSKFFSVKIK